MIRDILSANSIRPGAAPAACVLGPDVVFVVIDDRTGRLLDLGGHFHALSVVATDMLLQVLNGPLAVAAEAVATRYRAPIDQVAADLMELLDDLEHRGLIRPAGTTPRRRLSSRLAGLLLPAAVRSILALPLSGRAKATLLLGLAHRSIPLFGWPGTVAAWRRVGVAPAGESAGRIEEIDEAVRAAANRHVLNTECKERGLVCWLMLRSAGVAARLTVGIDLYPFSSHCWCEAGGRILSDFADRCQRYTAVATYV
jgi:hypothetical protein